MFVLLVCGGRDYCDKDKAFSVLDKVHRKISISKIIEGGASGADSLARQWASLAGISCCTVPADWGKHGRAAGPIRNKEMLSMKPDGVLAFPGGRGTADMIQQAKSSGIKVMEVSA